MTRTMQALQLTEPGHIEVREVPVPEIGPDEVLVKVAGAGLCQSDLHILRDWPFPDMTLGHETAGHVAEVGRAVTGLDEGDPVLVSLVWACGHCRACLEGRDNVCITLGARNGMPPCPGIGPDGGMAEFIKVGARYLQPLGDLDPVAAAPLADAGLTPMHAVNSARYRLTPGATAVVIGIGGLGHVGVQILKQTSAARIVAIDVTEDKLALARTHGADETVLSGESAAPTVLELTAGYGADAVFDFVGTQPTVDLAIGVVAPGGALRLVGLGGGRFDYVADVDPTLPWGVDVSKSYAGTRADQLQVIELARAGKLAVDVTRYPLADGVQAFADLAAGKVTGRAVLVP